MQRGPISDRARSLRPSDSTTAVAARSLQQQFQTLLEFLPLAAKHADDDVEYVHQLRVSTRRAIAEIKIYSDLLPRKRSRRICHKLRLIRKAAGEARDLDVMLARISSRPNAKSKSAARRIENLRQVAQDPILKVYAAFAKDGSLEKELQQLVRRLRPRGKHARKESRFDEWARLRLRRVSRRFFDAESTDIKNLAGIHRFRIRGKQLRYTLDTLGSAFDQDDLEKAIASLKRLQQRLGDINDRVVSIARIRRWIRDSGAKRERRQLKSMLDAEKKSLRRELKSYKSWWTKRRSRGLDARVGCLLN